MSHEDETADGRSTGRPLRLALAALLLVAALGALGVFLRGLRQNAPSGSRARAALSAGNTAEARRLAQAASDLAGGEDREALTVLDELDLAAARTRATPRERAEAVLSAVPRTEAGRQAAERAFFADAEEAVLANDGSTLEEIRFAVRAWPNAATVNAQLVALRELVVLQRCVNATKLVCATFFPAPTKRHAATAPRIEALRSKQVAHATRVFQESQALLKTKPDPTVAGAAQRDQVLAAAEHVALASPTERDAEIAAYAATHSPEAFHAKPKP